MTNIRTFIAIELDQTIRKILEDVVIYLKKNNIKDVRWVTPANIHLTLKFLGDTTEDKLPVVYQAIFDSIHQEPFEIELSKAGVFPNLRQPRVVWVGINESPSLLSLQEKIDQVTSKFGFPKEKRKFSAHLTIGRVKDFASQEQLIAISNAITNIPTIKPEMMLVKEFILFKSDLRPTGSVYTPIYHFGLIK